MDRYNERLVPGRPGSEARLVFGVGIMLILAAVGLVAAGFAVKPIIALGSLPAVVLGVYIIIYSRQLFQVEFEYLLVNGDMQRRDVGIAQHQLGVGAYHVEIHAVQHPGHAVAAPHPKVRPQQCRGKAPATQAIDGIELGEFVGESTPVAPVFPDAPSMVVRLVHIIPRNAEGGTESGVSID